MPPVFGIFALLDSNFSKSITLDDFDILLKICRKEGYLADEEINILQSELFPEGVEEKTCSFNEFRLKCNQFAVIENNASEIYDFIYD